MATKVGSVYKTPMHNRRVHNFRKPFFNYYVARWKTQALLYNPDVYLRYKTPHPLISSHGGDNNYERCGFNWSRTPEGHSFWEAMFDNRLRKEHFSAIDGKKLSDEENMLLITVYQLI